MIDSLHKSFQLLSKQPAATTTDVAKLCARFPKVDVEFLEFVSEATEVELQHDRGQYIRIWNPCGCVEMDDGYGISARILGAVPIGDDGGGRVLFYLLGKKGYGLYCVGYGNLCAEDAVYVAPSLKELILNAEGMSSFYL